MGAAEKREGDCVISGGVEIIVSAFDHVGKLNAQQVFDEGTN